MGIPATRARSEMNDFLLKDNRNPAVILGYPLSRTPAHKIEVLRPAAKEGKLVIIASAATVREIRKLSWNEFRSLQHKFGCWLVRQNQPKYLLNCLNKPIAGFADLFEEKLRNFWRKVVYTARFDDFFSWQEPLPLDALKPSTAPYIRYFPQQFIRVADSARTLAGEKLGVVPLRLGMRLAIHWGGTAVYGFGFENITRQTTTEASFVELTSESGKCILSTHSRKAMGRLTTAIVGGNLTLEPPSAIRDYNLLPFGDNAANKIVPIFNEFDLRKRTVLSSKTEKPTEGDLSLSGTPIIVAGHSDNQKRRRVVAQIAPIEDGEIAPATGITRFVIKAEADGVADNGILSLFGEKSATAFRPNLRLARNDSFLDFKATSCLVYVCAPVYYPELVRMANRFFSPIEVGAIPPDMLSEDTLKARIKAVLKHVLGIQLCGYYDLRVDCKHSFSAGMQRFTSAFLILPIDYKYRIVNALAEDLVKRYLDFLGKGHAREVIQSVSNAALVLGLQVASKKDAHVLLEIESLEFAFKP
ncbi:MAG: hypothetical protein JWM59_40 [Verrucomicrobiales bacterium]|nr:hypothetical protein [Verrucomicrobiales bacterium]